MSNETETAPAELPASDYMSDIPFDALGLSEEILRSITEKGYTKPTPVQAAAIPAALAGKDLIVRSKTGTGKTAAFAIPILEKIPAGTRKPQSLVLCPTRELAVQVAAEAAELCQHKDLRVCAIYGGASMDTQLRALEDGAEFLVGTPGRVWDHIRRGTLDLSQAKFAVLDEADEMLSMGFYEEVTKILEQFPKDRQTLLFSATVPADIDRLIRKYMKEPETLLLQGDVYTVEGITHVSYKMVDAYPKPRNLLYLLELENPDSAIIFSNTRDDTALVTAVLNRNGYDAELLNGDLPQKERERVMAKVKKGEVRYMVATDIAARGIDISDLSHVINYSLPEDAAVYLHRVGRTGRIGKSGTAISLIGGRDFVTLTTLQKQYGVTFEQRQLPTAEEARKLWAERHVAELREGMGSSVFEAFIPLAQELKSRPDGEYLLAYALKYFFTHHRMDRIAAQRAKERAEAGIDASEFEKKAPRERPARSGERRERPERGGRGERGERGERSGRSERAERPPLREKLPTAEGAPVAAAEGGAEPTPAPERPRRPRRTEEADGPAAVDERGTKLWIGVGRNDGLTDGAAVTALLTELSGGDAGKVRHAELRDLHAYAWVEPEAADSFLAANGKLRGEKSVKVEKARPPRRR